MNYYNDIYLRRVNRYGNSYQDRALGKRIEAFNNYLQKSLFKTSFTDTYANSHVDGILKPYKNDETQTLNYLLVSLDFDWPPGTVFDIRNKRWMILYKEDLVNTGYNKYIMMKMTHNISWKDRNGDEHWSPAYYNGPMTEKMYDMLRTYLKGVVYKESNKYAYLIMPKNDFILRQDYIIIDNEPYEVTGFDKISSPGIMYVTINETYLRDVSEPPRKESTDTEEEDKDFFWFNGE